MDKGWIKLHRSILAWEWYDDLNTFRLFMHLLLTVNFEPKKWRGIDVNRGQIITSNAHLADQTGLTVQQIRTAIKKLISTNEITTKATNKNTLVTLVNYEVYQSKEDMPTNKTTSEPTNKQQSSNNQVTTTKEVKNKRIKEKDIPLDYSSFGLDQNYIDKILEVREENSRSKLKKPATKLSQGRIESLSREIKKVYEKGYTIDEILDKWKNRVWVGFDADWFDARGDSKNITIISGRTKDRSIQDGLTNTDWAQ